MSFNICQLFILFGLFLGIICTSILLGSSSVKRRSNFFLSLLIIAFIGNLGQYWLEDVGFISKQEMLIIFVPWQMLVAPLFLLYVYSLRIFNQYPFRKLILFVPFLGALGIHMIVKYQILSNGLETWENPEWVSYFFLIEELLSLLYCLVAAILVYRWIWIEKERSNYVGFGVNKEIVKWIKTILQMGLVLAIIWLLSLYVVNTTHSDISGYYFLWCLMAIVLNILGFVGIIYSLQAGRFSEIDFTKETERHSNSSSAKSEFKVSAPTKYLNDERIGRVFSLTGKFAKSHSESVLKKHLQSWFQSEYSIDEVNYQIYESRNILSNNNKNLLVIPIASESSSNQMMVLDLQAARPMDEAGLYFINMAVQAFSYYKIRIANNLSSTKINSDHKVYRSLIHLLENEEVYTNPQVDLTSLSERLGVSVGFLSKVVNDACNRSFNELINDYRIDKVKKIMADATYRNYTVEGYGLEAGFNSKSTFYKAFNKSEGMSPGKYFEKKLARRD